MVRGGVLRTRRRGFSPLSKEALGYYLASLGVDVLALRLRGGFLQCTARLSGCPSARRCRLRPSPVVSQSYRPSLSVRAVTA
jgi:hypothetical protein